MGERATVIKKKTQPSLEARPRGLGIHAFSEAGNENRASYGSERRNLEGTGNKPKHQGKLSSRQRLSLFTKTPFLCQISHPSHQHYSKSCPSVTQALISLISTFLQSCLYLFLPHLARVLLQDREAYHLYKFSP